MATVQTLRDLTALAELDARIAVLQTGVHAADAHALAEQTAHQARLAEIDSLAALISQSEIKLAAISKELRSVDSQMFAARQKHGRSRSEVEVNAAEREGEELRRMTRDLGTDRERTQESLDAARARLEVLKTIVAPEAKSAPTEPAVSDADGADLASLRATRESLSKAVPVVLLKRYEMVRARKGTTGLASTTDGICSGCHVSLSPATLSKMRQEPVAEVCPSCHRLVYYAPHIAQPVAHSVG